MPAPPAGSPPAGLDASGCAHSAVTKRAAKSRQKTKAGGSGVETSPRAELQEQIARASRGGLDQPGRSLGVETGSLRRLHEQEVSARRQDRFEGVCCRVDRRIHRDGAAS
jgi:hypothetical protein